MPRSEGPPLTAKVISLSATNATKIYISKPRARHSPCSPQSRPLMTLGKRPFENTVGKGENAGNQHFSPFPTMFSILP